MASSQPAAAATGGGGAGEEDDYYFHPSLEHLADQGSLKWIFVGGKGGVGKTTVSCSLGVQLALRGNRVLIVSTDPAHNLSDAFSQKFSTTPIAVKGMKNLSCMELDPSEAQAAPAAASADPQLSALQEMAASSGLKEAMMQMPGIDELMGLGALVRTLNSYDFDKIVFDTAPTGHTLRLLSLPATALGLLDKLESQGGLLSMAMKMLGGAGGGMGGMMSGLRDQFASVQAAFTDPAITTFVPVCIPEFLSVYETERLVQQLARMDIDVHNVVVNQVLFPAAHAGGGPCALCAARSRMQGKYLGQVDLLYGEDFHVVHMPVVTQEVRGVPRLKAYSAFLMDPYDPGTHGSTTAPGFAGGVFDPPAPGPAPAPQESVVDLDAALDSLLG